MRKKKSGIIQQAAELFIARLETRFPETELMITASILDPNIQHAEAVDNWLRRKKSTRAILLRKICNEMNIVLNIDEQPREEQSDVHSAPRRSKHADIRISLLHKHSVLNRSNNTLENELNNFIKIREEVSDVLLFWKREAHHYPKMSKIAEVILAIPATSAKSESCFSASGALLCSRRASIEPLRAEKVLFVHDNYNYCAQDLF